MVFPPVDLPLDGGLLDVRCPRLAGALLGGGGDDTDDNECINDVAEVGDKFATNCIISALVGSEDVDEDEEDDGAEEEEEEDEGGVEDDDEEEAKVTD
eukprot:CAMPEP_0203636448 /NCGR_PEP_ID=MMETSP0088-20131115/2990_1 /ASSEMBLY_ACC=CAM_ASM_001087 /TAXON_ID=426623 /ORGANISM="Chaetoceros affinis, Strain CCMP159" /LENGTH=97 /DNA_ID=CAMNT_0050490581 /DNA_START=439 /DNA_END=732 /DNA_ORIENTATION=+